MKKYEIDYLFFEKSSAFGGIESRIKSLGEQGWLMTGIVKNSEGYFYWFAKEKPEILDDTGPM